VRDDHSEGGYEQNGTESKRAEAKGEEFPGR
jgi:hypothetical protein